MSSARDAPGASAGKAEALGPASAKSDPQGCQAWLGHGAQTCSTGIRELVEELAVQVAANSAMAGCPLAAAVVGYVFPTVDVTGTGTGTSSSTSSSTSSGAEGTKKPLTATPPGRRNNSWRLDGPHGTAVVQLLLMGFPPYAVAEYLHIDRKLVERVASKLSACELYAASERADRRTAEENARIAVKATELADRYVREHRMTRFPAGFAGLVPAGDRHRKYYSAGESTKWVAAIRTNNPNAARRQKRIDAEGRAAVVKMAQALQASGLPLTAAGKTFVHLVNAAQSCMPASPSASTSSTTSSSASSSSASSPSASSSFATAADPATTPASAGPGAPPATLAAVPVAGAGAAVSSVKPKRKACHDDGDTPGGTKKKVKNTKKNKKNKKNKKHKKKNKEKASKTGGQGGARALRHVQDEVARLSAAVCRLAALVEGRVETR